MEDQVQQDPVSEAAGQQAIEALSPLQQDALIYGILALLITCFVVYANKNPMVRDAGFFAKVLCILAGTALGTVGGMIGNALRKAVHPDAILTSGGFWSLLWAKVFWKWGPQMIGLAIGVIVGPAIVLH